MTTPHNNNREPLADKIIERIEQDNVVPKPRWQFTLLNRAFWVFFAVSLLVASLAAGAMMFALANAGWEFRTVTHDSILSYLFDVLPFFWIALIVLLLLFAYETVKRTKWGYRYPVRTIVGFGALGILLGGAALYAGGFAEEVEEGFGDRIPLYRPVIQLQQRVWERPERGLLAGEIVEAEAGYATFTIRTFDGMTWVVNGDDLRSRDREYLTAHRVVRLVGTPVEAGASSIFHACFTFPWEVQSRAIRDMEQHAAVLPPPPDESFVRKFVGERSTECRGVRPYDVLKAMRQEP